MLGRIECMRCSLFLPMITVSVSLSCGSTSLQCTKTDQRIKMPFGVNILGAHATCNIVRWGSWSPTQRDHVTYLWILGPPRISGMVEGTKLKFCVHVDGNKNYAKVGNRGGWVTWPISKFWDPPHISRMTKLERNCAYSVGNAFDAAFVKLLWPLVLIIAVQLGLYIVLWFVSVINLFHGVILWNYCWADAVIWWEFGEGENCP